MKTPLTPEVKWSAQHPPAANLQYTSPSHPLSLPRLLPLSLFLCVFVVLKNRSLKSRTDMFYKETAERKHLAYFRVRLETAQHILTVKSQSCEILIGLKNKTGPMSGSGRIDWSNKSSPKKCNLTENTRRKTLGQKCVTERWPKKKKRSAMRNTDAP